MLAQQLVNGVLLGATYALFALGFTLMFGVLRVINLTYGFYFSAGAFMALWLTRQAGLGDLGGAAGGGVGGGVDRGGAGLAAADAGCGGCGRRSWRR